MSEPKVVHEWKDEKYHIQAVLENEDSGWYRLDEIHHPGDDLSGLNVTHRWGLHGSVAKELARLDGELERRKDLYESCLDSLEVEAKEHARLAARVQELEGQIITAINGLEQYKEMVLERDAENRRLREALERFGDHSWNCHCKSPRNSDACTCGLDAALEEKP